MDRSSRESRHSEISKSLTKKDSVELRVMHYFVCAFASALTAISAISAASLHKRRKLQKYDEYYGTQRAFPKHVQRAAVENMYFLQIITNNRPQSFLEQLDSTSADCA